MCVCVCVAFPCSKTGAVFNKSPGHCWHLQEIGLRGSFLDQAGKEGHEEPVVEVDLG